MSSSILETIRVLHEETEVLERAAGIALETKPKSYYGSLLADAKVAAYLKRIQDISARLVKLYEDADATKRVEAATLSGKGSSSSTTTVQAAGAAALDTFYSRLQDIKLAAASTSLRSAGVAEAGLQALLLASASAAGPSADFSTFMAGLNAAVEAELLSSWFTAEEVRGRFLDLSTAGLWDSWCSLPGVKEARSAGAALTASSASSSSSFSGPSSIAALLTSSSSSSDSADFSALVPLLPKECGTVDLPSFLARLPELCCGSTLPQRLRGTKQYRRFLASFCQYLCDQWQKGSPLSSLEEELLGPLTADFLSRWKPIFASSLSSDAASSIEDPTPGYDRAWLFPEPSSSSSSSSASENSGGDSSTGSGGLVDISSFSSEGELHSSLGAEGLKLQLTLRGLKAGGTPQERAARLWSVKGLTKEQYPKKLLAGGSAAPLSSSSSSSAAAVASAAVVSGPLPVSVATGGALATVSSLRGSHALPAIEVSSWFASHVAPAVVGSHQHQSQHNQQHLLGLCYTAFCEELFTLFVGRSSSSSSSSSTSPSSSSSDALSSASAAGAVVVASSSAGSAAASSTAEGLFRPVILATKKRLERKALRTAQEWQAEREAEDQEVELERKNSKLRSKGLATAADVQQQQQQQAGSSHSGASYSAAGGMMLDGGDDDDDDDDEQGAGKGKYQSSVVVDETGKPIPAWLYKLHGLNLQFPCEICGGEVYRGRRAFERHFQEPKHAYGMRCLGIPNTKHFQDITTIADALLLWERLKQSMATSSAGSSSLLSNTITTGTAQDGSLMTLHGLGLGITGSATFNRDAEEEFEDSAGNVVSRRTFVDLQRQGLL